MTKTCDECGSTYNAETSAMVALCPECSHRIYGYPPCEHMFEDVGSGKRCTRCGWDGSRSKFVRNLVGSSSGEARYPCPCCGFPTLDEPPPGTFAICPICWWEDDNGQFADPSYRGGANAVSLQEARASYAAIGASEPRFLANVRQPTDAERAARDQ